MRYPRDVTIPLGQEGKNYTEYRTIQVIFVLPHSLLELKCYL